MNDHKQIDQWLTSLNLSWIKENYEPLLKQAVSKQTGPLDYLAELLRGETEGRAERAIARRIRAARFPVQKSIDTFNWQWPQDINRQQVEQLLGLRFIDKAENAVFVGPVGVGKTHLATAIGLQACRKGYKVLYCNTIEAINDLLAAQNHNRLKEALRKYTTPNLLVLDELGYLPIDKHGANLLFQIISLRYEKGSIMLTTNKAFKDWPEIFNNDSTLASAVLDRLLHHCDTTVIKGSSFRMRKTKT